MRIGIIDLGTNSVRFDVHQLGPGRRVRQLHREKIMVRLGQGVFLNGKLDRSAMTRTLHAFLRFRKIATQYRAGKIIAFGTSALREVSDRESFLETLRSRTGIELRVISGDEEAQLISLGILSQGKHAGKGKLALVDIGGGSTEINICRGKKVIHSRSFPLGTARLQQLYLKQSPPEAESLENLRALIRGTLTATMITERWPKVDRVIGSSGTVRALAKLLTGADTKPFARKGLEDLIEKIGTMTTTELLGLSGMEGKRVDMILAGAILFDECMRALGAKKATPTERSLRDGILEEELRLFLQGDQSHLALHLPELIEKAVGFGVEEAHVLRVAALGEDIFDALKSVHRLDDSWKIYLKAALILRNTGEAISIAGHEEHSYYIVRNSQFHAASPWETELIAQLCRQHGGAKTEVVDGMLARSKPRREAFTKLLAILRLVDALDSGSETVIKLRKGMVGTKGVRLALSGRNLTGLEMINVEKRAPYVEKTLGRRVSIVLGPLK